MKEMDDAELRSALEEHHPECFGWALSCCSHDISEAETVLQTVYLKVLEGKAKWSGFSTFRTWLFSVIRKTAMERRRRSFLRRLRFVPLAEKARVIAHSQTPDGALDGKRLRIAFRKLLLKLPRRQQEVLHLVFYHDLTLEEAAQIMGVSVGSARTHYERGKNRIRSWTKEKEIAGER